MKSKYLLILYLMCLVIAVGENPAYGCSIDMGILTETHKSIAWLFVVSACLSLPVSFWFWRIKKIKARFTILPSLFAVILALAAAVFIDQELSSRSALISKCQKQQGVGMLLPSD